MLAALAVCALWLVSVPSRAEGPIGTTGGPDVPIQGCFYYEHSNFSGSRKDIPDGLRRMYVGENWNDKISSIACRPGCRLHVWSDRDFRGAHRSFSGNIAFVGDVWNDQISSLEVECGDESVQVVSNAGKCLDVFAPDRKTNGARVQVWECNAEPQQSWRIVGNTLRSGGKCLDAHAPEQSMNGGRVQVWDCNGSQQQTWLWDRGTRMIKSGVGKCLDVHAPDQMVNGAKVQIWDCNRSVQQRWELQARH